MPFLKDDKRIWSSRPGQHLLTVTTDREFPCPYPPTAKSEIEIVHADSRDSQRVFAAPGRRRQHGRSESPPHHPDPAVHARRGRSAVRRGASKRYGRPLRR